MKPFRHLVAALLLAAALPALAQDAFKARLDALADAYAKLNINAVVLVGNRDGIQYERAFGYADLEKKIPMTTTTRFKTESVGKIFTATRILELVEQGKIKLDDKAARYLPGWNIPDWDKITVHQLLNHTSGMASPWDHPKYDFAKIHTPAEMKQFIEEVPPVAKPGVKYYYSNSGYYLLGQIIAAVTGRSFDDDLRAAIFDPAGMNHTGHLNASVLPPDVARPYIYYSSTDYRIHPMAVSPRAMGAGGWMSVARDLFSFAQNYQNNRFISPATQAMQRSANGAEDLARAGNHYGYGVEVFANTLVPGKLMVGHSGGGAGYSVDLFFEPESGETVILLCNMFAMNRDMSSNFLDAALGLPTRPAAHFGVVRAVDLLKLKGLKYFQDDPERFFKEIGVAKHGGYFMEMLTDSLKEIGQAEMAKAVQATMKAQEAPKTAAGG